MTNDFELQALAVETVAERHADSDLGRSLRDAITTLKALALLGDKSIIQALKLKDVCEEMVNHWEANTWFHGHEDTLDFLNRIQKILNSK